MLPHLIVTAICAALFIAHGALMLGHRQKMRSESTDKPHDPLFSPFNQALSLIAIIGFQALALYKRVAQPDHDFFYILSLPANDFTLVVGTLVFTLGFALRIWAIRILGRLFTFEIGIRSKHKIIEQGPYRLIRHPSYSGYALMLIGLGIAYASLLYIVGALAGTLTFFYLRMNQEERMLINHFGTSYREYIRRTWRLIPWVY